MAPEGCDFPPKSVRMMEGDHVMGFVRKSSFLVLICGALSACSPSGDGLAGNKVEPSNCPPSGCVDATPDQNQLTVSNSGKTSMVSRVQQFTPASPDFVEIGGSCYSSSYPNNRIEVKVYHGGDRVNVTSADIVSLRMASTAPRCVNGRFALAIRGDRMPAGYNYRVEVAIVGIDADGQEFRNTGTGVFNVTVQRIQ